MAKKTSPEQKQKLWIEAMLSNGGNATQAAVAAGYKKGDAAKKAGHRMSTNVYVAAELAKRRAEVLERAQAITGLTVERTLREVARLAYSSPKNLFKADGSLIPITELDDDAAATIASIERDELKADGLVVGQTVKIKVWDKNAALEKAMKHLGQYEADNEQKPPAVLMPGVRTVKFEPLKGRAKSPAA